VRIAGVDIPNEKRVVVALTYIYGIGPASARRICEKAGVNQDTRVKNLVEEQGIKLRNIIENEFKVEGELRTELSFNIKRLIDINCYRGRRHRINLPVRGQRTRTNARTRKGPKVRPGVGKKKATTTAAVR
jgi:small subunit ribosomal protein S13